MSELYFESHMNFLRSQPLLRNLKDKVVSSLKKQILMRLEKLTKLDDKDLDVAKLDSNISVKKGGERIDPI